MFLNRNSLSEYAIAKENIRSYEELCKEFSKTSSIFSYKPSSSEIVKSLKNKHKQSDSGGTDDEEIIEVAVPKKKVAVSEELHYRKKSPDVSNLTDIKELQKQFISSLGNLSALDIKLFKNVEPSEVCACDSPAISDDVLIQVCMKSEKVDDDIASVIGHLLLLPKMYHLSSKLAPSSCDALYKYARHHPKISVTSFLVPFLQLCPETKEQHIDLFKQLTEHCTSPLSSQLLQALSCKGVVSEADLDIFQHLCKNVDPQAEINHAAALSFLGKAVKNHHGLIKFGQNLLFVVKNMGKHLTDKEALQSLSNGHTSGMKKGIQIQLKKIL